MKETERAAPEHLLRALESEDFAPVRAALKLERAAPQTPEQWFAFFSAYKHGDASHALLVRVKTNTPGGGSALERFVIMSALVAASDKLDEKPVTLSIRRCFETMCDEMAADAAHWADHFDLESARFEDLARLASLRRFLAGDVGFEFGKRLPYDFFFRVHPLQLPAFVSHFLFKMRGAAPTLAVHFNYARKNRLILSQKDFERGLWRMAKMLEANPELTGISGNSWFHSAAVAKSFPRLAWMRDVFSSNGAFVIDLEAGHLRDLAYNSAQRRDLYLAGKFVPRHTVIMWARERVLQWAASRPDLADEIEQPITAPEGVAVVNVSSPRSRPETKQNAPLQLWDGVAVRRRYGMKYWAALFGAPSLLAAIAVGFYAGVLAGVLAFLAVVLLVDLIQYYFSQ